MFKSFLVVLNLLLISVFLPAESYALEKVKLHLKWKHQFQFAGYYTAIEKGFYKEAGLDVSLMLPTKERDAVSAVLSGEADFGISNSDLIIYKYNGAPVVVLGVIFQHSPLAIVARRDRVKRIEDLEYNDIMCGPDNAELYAMLKNMGFPLIKLSHVPFRYSAKDLISGEISAMSAYVSNENFQLQKAGVDYTQFRPIDSGIDFYGDNFFTTRGMVEDKPEIVEAFRAATIKGWAYAISHTDEAIDIILDNYSTPEISKESLKYEAETLKKLMVSNVIEIGYMNERRWRHIAETLVSLGMLPKYYSLDDFIYNKDKHLFDNKYFKLGLYSIAGMIVLLVATLYALSKNRLMRLKDKKISQIQRLSKTGDWSFCFKTDTVIIGKSAGTVFGIRGKHELNINDASKYIDKRDLVKVIKEWQKLKTTYQFECEFRITINDKKMWILAQAFITEDSKKEVAHGFVSDITDRKLRELTIAQHDEDMLRLVETVPVGIGIVSKRGIILVINRHIEEIFNMPKSFWIGKDVRKMDIFEDDLKLRVHDMLSGGYRSDGRRFDVKTANGEVKTIEITSKDILYEDSDCVLVMVNDITEMMAKEAQLRQAAAVFDVSAQAIVITDTDGIIRAVNPAFTKITGYSAVEAVGQNPRILKSGVHDDQFYVDMWNKLKNEGFWEGELWNRKKDGTIYLEWNAITAIKDTEGNIKEFVAQFSDIATRKLTEDEMRVKNNYDNLTGLANRILFIDLLDRMLNIAEKEHVSIVVVFIELDNFKKINEQYGYRNGDLFLQEISRLLKGCVEITDVVARQGGDEFLMALYNEDPDARLIVERMNKILKIINSSVEIDGNNVSLTASIGVSVYPIYNKETPEMLRYAELAMYKAKERGGNCFHFYDKSLSEIAHEANYIESALTEAIVNEEFDLYLQPVVDIVTNKIKGAEALLRWDNKDRGFISPDKFIPIAESTGYIKIIGLWVLDEACKHLVKIKKDNPDFYITVNVSVTQIPEALDPKLAYSSVKGFDLSPEDVIFEITESTLLENQSSATKWILEMKRFGFKVALDDFGTGYSSLSYLNMFPLDIMKIDKSFVMDILNNDSNRTLVEAMVSMAHKLGIKVISEGIETEEVFNILKDLGCNSAQGFLISRPVPLDNFLEVLKEYNS